MKSERRPNGAGPPQNVYLPLGIILALFMPAATLDSIVFQIKAYS